MFAEGVVGLLDFAAQVVGGQAVDPLLRRWGGRIGELEVLVKACEILDAVPRVAAKDDATKLLQVEARGGLLGRHGSQERVGRTEQSRSLLLRRRDCPPDCSRQLLLRPVAKRAGGQPSVLNRRGRLAGECVANKLKPKPPAARGLGWLVTSARSQCDMRRGRWKQLGQLVVTQAGGVQ